ncbi:GNAT family N-acetyltransferase [Chloroflexota bacterium]
MERLQVVCRPGREIDTGDMIELTSTIWNGDDYVPKTWADWLADERGLLAVAEYQGRVLGLGKLSRLTEDAWWLKGLRVHPAYEGRGIASQLNQYMMAYWLQHGCGTIRLATSAKRVQVHRLCRRHSMKKILELTWFVSIPLAQAISITPFQPVTPAQTDQAVRFAQNSQTLELTGGLMDLIWQYAPPAATLLAEDIKDGRAFWWRRRAGLLSLINEPDEHGISTATIKLLAGKRADLPAILQDFHRLASAQAYPQAGWMAPFRDDIIQVLNETGFERSWDSSLYLFARDHPGG